MLFKFHLYHETFLDTWNLSLFPCFSEAQHFNLHLTSQYVCIISLT